MKLLVRTIPLPGECLSSFIQRIARLNLIDAHDLWRLLNTNKHYPQSSLSTPIDIYPYSLIDLNRFSELLELPLETLERLTFLPVFEKFGIDIESCSSSRILSSEVERYRKFCPKCLKLNEMYKLIWQVSSINFCPIHNILLVKKCPYCNRQIPILPSQSEIGICPHCNAIFTDCMSDYYATDPTDRKRLGDWEYILDYDEKGLLNIGTYSREQSIAIKLVYFCGSIKNPEQEDQLKLLSIKQAARDSQSNKKNVHLDTIFHFINKSGLSIQDFLRFDVPSVFVEDLLTKRPKQTEKYSCIAPWCDHYNVPGSLSRKPTSVKILKSGDRKKYYMYCNSCGTEYCLDSDGTIFERGNFINFAWTQTRESLINYRSVHDIITQYNTTEDKVRRAAIFLATNNLIDPTLIPYKIPSSHDCEIESNIKNLIKENTPSKQIKKIHKMNYNDFLFYWLYSEVKVAYLENCNHRLDKTNPRDLHKKEFESAICKLLSNGTDITLKNICSELNICHETLRGWGLFDEVKKYKRQQQDIKNEDFKTLIMIRTDEMFKTLYESNIKISSDDFYKQLGIRRTVLVRNHPELTKYIHDKLQYINLHS